jgi:hypothetical protein
MSQNHSEFRPAWYEDELERLASLEEHPHGRTWSHPTDVLFLIAFVALMTAIFVGWFG